MGQGGQALQPSDGYAFGITDTKPSSTNTRFQGSLSQIRSNSPPYMPMRIFIYVYIYLFLYIYTYPHNFSRPLLYLMAPRALLHAWGRADMGWVGVGVRFVIRKLHNRSAWLYVSLSISLPLVLYNICI